MTVATASSFERLCAELTAKPRVWLVTGVAGFIGSNLLEHLLKLGQIIVGLDNYATGHRSNLDEVTREHPTAATRFRMIEGDIRDSAVCRDACRGVDYVLHQAALGSVPRSIKDPATTNAVNVAGFLNMLTAAKDAGVRRFVFASSSSVYGDATTLPQTESRTGRPLSPYAVSKAANELYATAFANSYGLPSIGLRYFNVFGRRQDPAGAYAAVIPRWVSNLLNNVPCEIFGDGETSRDFCYIGNTVQANLVSATVENDEAIGQIYNIACGETTSLNQLFQMIRDGLRELGALGADVGASVPIYRPFRTGDIRHSRASIDKARQLLGYEPTHHIADGLKEALAWYASTAARGGDRSAAD